MTAAVSTAAGATPARAPEGAGKALAAPAGADFEKALKRRAARERNAPDASNAPAERAIAVPEGPPGDLFGEAPSPRGKKAGENPSAKVPASPLPLPAADPASAPDVPCAPLAPPASAGVPPAPDALPAALADAPAPAGEESAGERRAAEPALPSVPPPASQVRAEKKAAAREGARALRESADMTEEPPSAAAPRPRRTRRGDASALSGAGPAGGEEKAEEEAAPSRAGMSVRVSANAQTRHFAPPGLRPAEMWDAAAGQVRRALGGEAAAFSPAVAASPQKAGAKTVRLLEIRLQPENLGVVTARLVMKGERMEVFITVPDARLAERLGRDMDKLEKSVTSAVHAGVRVSAHISVEPAGPSAAPAQHHGQPGFAGPEGRDGGERPAQNGAGSGRGEDASGARGENGRKEHEREAPAPAGGPDVRGVLYL